MKRRILCILLLTAQAWGQAIIIDHNCAKLAPIPTTAIQQAKNTLHIAYGHTSHGSQLTDGMAALVGQDSLIGYKGDIYEWNNGGTGGALDLHDYAMSGDLGHTGDTTWAQETRNYLNDPANSDVNVIMWSWCGGCSDNTVEGINIYLNKMNQLEQQYPNVKFVYMTGHRDIWADDTLKRNNQLIRDYCINNNKILYDFADIESYDPDGTYYEYCSDDCSYYNSSFTLLGNWAQEYQNTHQQGIYWYDMSAAHTEPLNGNLKAYAAWWLFCRIAGWDGSSDVSENTNIPSEFRLEQNYPNPFNPTTKIRYSIPSEVKGQRSNIILKVYDMLGQEIQTLVNKEQSPGEYEVEFNADGLPSGIYFYKLTTANFSETKKMILLK